MKGTRLPSKWIHGRPPGTLRGRGSRLLIHFRPGRPAFRLALLALVGLAAACTSDGSLSTGVSKEAVLAAKTVQVTPVVRREFQRRLESTGSLMPRERAVLRALVEGPVEAVYVDIGDPVEEDQLLLQTRPVESRLELESAAALLKTAESALRELQAWRRPEEIDLLKAELTGLKSERDRLRNERERAAILLEKGAISTSEWEAVRTETERSEANFEAARERLHIAERGPTRESLEVAESRVAERMSALALARQKLRDTGVRAPFEGIITGKSHRPGDYAKRGDTVLEISNLNVLEAEMQVPERYSGLVQVGLPVQLKVESLSEQREGQVIAVNEAIDRTTRTFLVKIRVDNSDHSIKAGAFCTGVFQLEPLENAMAVPEAAVREQGGRSLVWVPENGLARQIVVQTGERNDGYVQIRKGLSGGEQVVIQGAGALSEGDALTVISKSG